MFGPEHPNILVFFRPFGASMVTFRRGRRVGDVPFVFTQARPVWDCHVGLPSGTADRGGWGPLVHGVVHMPVPSVMSG